ncbi:hypothetical protein D3C85_1661680 [compost metagenome]
MVMPSWFIVPESVPFGCNIVPLLLPLPVLILLLSTLLGATFCLASGATWPALAAALACPLLSELDASAASAAPLAIVSVAVRKRVASLVIFIVMLLFWLLFAG